MVGHLQFQGMDNTNKEKNRESLLDSPDSGLPPSPSPPFYSLSPGGAENKAVDKNSCTEILDQEPGREGPKGKQIFLGKIEVLAGGNLLICPSLNKQRRITNKTSKFATSGNPRGFISVTQKPSADLQRSKPRFTLTQFKDMWPWCNSEIKYSSEKHFRDDIFYHPRPTVTTYRESVTVAPNCTWRNYKSQLLFEPRQKPLRYQSTTIIFPKRAKNIYRTTLNCRLGCAKRWFASSVQLALCEGNNAYLTPPENLSG
ncbi:refilin-A-like [Notechis scutatus]|uniref:Refilin-A-like n=1 Tax=Notechis scutatus TaxID=8663 RepID=A0A6J1VDG4_9SAUR|nr:refilin-A-like [Notechis scutatus]